MATITSHSIHADHLRPEVRDTVKTFAQCLVQDLGEHLHSLTIVGSTLTDDYHPGRSDINSVLIVDKLNHHILKALARHGPQFGRQGLRAPWVMTQHYLERSLDVFGVEFLDFQINHATVVGPDPFTGLNFQKECVRLQCERDLRSAQINLMQGFLRSLGKYQDIRQILIDAVKQLLTLLRAMLWLIGRDRPRTARATIEAAGEAFGLDEQHIAALLTLKFQDESFGPEGTELLFDQVDRAVELLCDKVDQMKTDA